MRWISVQKPSSRFNNVALNVPEILSKLAAKELLDGKVENISDDVP